VSDPKALTWLRVDGESIFLKSTPTSAEQWLALLDEIPTATQAAEAQKLRIHRRSQWETAASVAANVSAHMVVSGTPDDPLGDALTLHVETVDSLYEALDKYVDTGAAAPVATHGYLVALIDRRMSIHLAVRYDPQDDRPAPEPAPEPDAPQWAPPLSSPPVSQSVNVAAGVSTEFRSPWQDTAPLAPVSGLFPTPAPHVRAVPPRLTRGWRR
jgi:hypothetical protein